MNEKIHCGVKLQLLKFKLNNFLTSKLFTPRVIGLRNFRIQPVLIKMRKVKCHAANSVQLRRFFSRTTKAKVDLAVVQPS